MAACVVGVAALTVVACGPSEEPPAVTESPAPSIEITGTGGVPPTLTYPTPLVLDESVTEVAWEGDGDELAEGDAVLLQIYSEDGTDASVVRNDFTSVPAAYLLTPEAIGSELVSVLLGHRVGSRIMYAAQQDGSPLVTSIDILPTRAQGELREPEAGLPAVTRADDGTPTVAIPQGAPAPVTPVVQQLIRGTGNQVATGDQAVIQFVAVKWSTGEVFDTTWGAGKLPQTVTLGADQLIEGFEDGLVDLPAGSEVMLVVPPGLGFGPSGNELSAETLVYVVDILAVSPPPA